MLFSGTILSHCVKGRGKGKGMTNKCYKIVFYINENEGITVLEWNEKQFVMKSNMQMIAVEFYKVMKGNEPENFVHFKGWLGVTVHVGNSKRLEISGRSDDEVTDVGHGSDLICKS